MLNRLEQTITAAEQPAFKPDDVLAAAENMLIPDEELFLFESLYNSLKMNSQYPKEFMCSTQQLLNTLTHPVTKVLCNRLLDLNYSFTDSQQSQGVNSLPVSDSDLDAFAMNASLSSSFLRLKKAHKDHSDPMSLAATANQIKLAIQDDEYASENFSLLQRKAEQTTPRSVGHAEFARNAPTFNHTTMIEGILLVWRSILASTHNQDNNKASFVRELARVNFRNSVALTLLPFFKIISDHSEIILINHHYQVNKVISERARHHMKAAIDAMDLADQKRLRANCDTQLQLQKKAGLPKGLIAEEQAGNQSIAKITQDQLSDTQITIRVQLAEEFGLLYAGAQEEITKQMQAWRTDPVFNCEVINQITQNIQTNLNDLCAHRPENLKDFQLHIQKLHNENVFFQPIIQGWQRRIAINHNAQFSMLIAEYDRLIQLENYRVELLDQTNKLVKQPNFSLAYRELAQQCNTLKTVLNNAFKDLELHPLKVNYPQHNNANVFKKKFNDLKQSTSVLEVKLQHAVVEETKIFKSYQYPASYEAIKTNSPSPVAGAIAILNDYAKKGFFYGHFNRHHQILANTMVKHIQNIACDDQVSGNQKQESIMHYLNQVKYQLIATEKLAIDPSKKPSSFLRRLHFATDQILVNINQTAPARLQLLK